MVVHSVCATERGQRSNRSKLMKEEWRAMVATGFVRCALILGTLMVVGDGGKKLSHPAFTGSQSQAAVLKILYW